MNALAIPNDDSALQERLTQEREKAVRGYGGGVIPCFTGIKGA